MLYGLGCAAVGGLALGGPRGTDCRPKEGGRNGNRKSDRFRVQVVMNAVLVFRSRGKQFRAYGGVEDVGGRVGEQFVWRSKQQETV